jgi:diketogulonate reductase-like aldo/keto reductase
VNLAAHQLYCCAAHKACRATARDPALRGADACVLQVLIRWALQRGTSVLPKSVNPARIKANFDVVSWAIPDDMQTRLSSLPNQQRMVAGAFLTNPAGPYKTIAELWDE